MLQVVLEADVERTLLQAEAKELQEGVEVDGIRLADVLERLDLIGADKVRQNYTISDCPELRLTRRPHFLT